MGTEKLRRRGPVVLVSRPIAYTFPLSYAYLAGYLKEQGIEVIILFRDVDQKELVKKIMDLKPLLVGFGSLYPELTEIKSIISDLNNAGRDFPIVVGGQMVSPIPEFALKLTGADFGIIGEGEIILYQLVKALQSNSSCSRIGGLAVRIKNQVTVFPDGEYIDDLSKLPKIPYELFDETNWLHIGRWYAWQIPEQPHWRFGDRVINIHGGRGCPFKCNFCYHHNKPRYRDMNEMMDEAVVVLERFNANMLYFSDDLVIATPKRVRELIDRIKKINNKISYSISTRFDILEKLDDSLLHELNATGCRIMGLGIESGSDRILKIIGKNTTAEKILFGLERLKNAGILPTVSTMVGQYTEKREDVVKSYELMKASVKVNPLIQHAFSIATPFPGSALYDLLFEKKLVKDDEDFYNQYMTNMSRIGDWSQVVNLSAMPAQEVFELRNLLEKSFIEEKRKAYGPELYGEIVAVCQLQRKAGYQFASMPIEEQAKRNQAYTNYQLELEKKKLTLFYSVV